MTDAIPFAELSRALVVKLRHHGDVLLAAPVLAALKRAAPQCEIDALVYAETTPMLEGHPALAQLHGIDRRWKQQGSLAKLTAEWALLSRLRARSYDLVIHLTEHRRGAWLARLIDPRWSVAPKQKSGFWKKSFTHLYGQPLNARRHTVERNLDALRRLGLVITAEDKRVELVPGPSAELRVGDLLAAQGVTTSFVHIHPTSRWRFKCWPTDHVAALIDAIASRGLPVVLTAAPEAQEQELIADIVRATKGRSINLSGQLDLKELAALSARARLFVGVDSAPMHIAAAMGTPAVALFGPSGELEWAPWGRPRQGEHRVITSDDHPCRPCGIDGCGGGKISECLTSVSVERVLQAVDTLLAS